MGNNKKIFICGFSQESNSFNPIICGYEKFDISGICEGEECVKPEMGGKCLASAGGMLRVLESEGFEPVGSVIMRGGSNGHVDHNVIERFLEKVISALRGVGEICGVLAALHGATVSDKCEDVCGYILETLRKEVGEDMPIAASFDLHANITEKIACNTDYICGFRKYPHIDKQETGERAAKFLVEHIKGNTAKTVRCAIPMIAPANGYTTGSGALKELMAHGAALMENGEIMDFTIFQVQPWLDVSKISSTVIVIAKDEEKAKKAALELAKGNLAIRKELLGPALFTVEEVIEKAIANKDGKPVVLVDSADSPNAGSSSDSAYVVEKVLPYKDSLRCAVAVTDKKAVEKAFELGVGAVGDFMLGATIAPKLTKPVLVKGAYVRSLHDGEFFLHGPQESGFVRNLGKTAVLQVGKILINVTSVGRAEGDLNFYRSFGIMPELCDLVQIKACTSFRAGYESIASEICNTNTPGAAGPELLKLPYEKLPKPLYPFEEICEKDISEPTCCRQSNV